jgi:hypothetical protein
MMRPVSRVDYGRFVPVYMFLAQPAWDFSPVPPQTEGITIKPDLMRAGAADKIRSPNLYCQARGKLQDVELINPEKTLRKFIGSY